MRCAMAKTIQAESGQMSVELAVVLPVVLVIAVVIADIMAFLGCCAEFDRASMDAVIAHGVSPTGVQSDLSAVSAIESALEEAMGSDRAVEISVSASSVSSPTSALVSMSPHLVQFTCTMRYAPWPQHLSIAGIVMDAPFEIVHTRTLTVDRFRPGVVL